MHEAVLVGGASLPLAVLVALTLCILTTLGLWMCRGVTRTVTGKHGWLPREHRSVDPRVGGGASTSTSIGAIAMPASGDGQGNGQAAESAAAAAAAVGDDDGVMSPEDLAALVDAAKARLDAGDADGALGFALAAVKASNGGDLEAIGRALDAAKSKAASDRARVMRENPNMTEADASTLAAADAIRDDMLSRPSALKDAGQSGMLRKAMEGGDFVVCIRCGGLISRDRTEAHRTMWCPQLDPADIPDIPETDSDDDRDRR